MTRRIRDLHRLLGPGWQIVPTRRNHLKLLGPEGQIYYTAGTPGDHRADRNMLGDLKRSQLRSAL